MKWWVSETSEKAAGRPGQPTLRAARRYVEVELPNNQGASTYVYVIPRQDVTEESVESAYVATCWGELFSEFDEPISDPTIARRLERNWPVFSEFAIKGLRGDYNTGAFMRLTDRDDGQPKWFVAVAADGVPFATGDTLVEACVNQIKLAVDASNRLAREIDEKGVPPYPH